MILAVAILAVAWGRLQRAGLTPGLKELLVLPPWSCGPPSCSSGYRLQRHRALQERLVLRLCHVMGPYPGHLQNRENTSLAGTALARTGTSRTTTATPATPTTKCRHPERKLDGLGHVVRNVTRRTRCR